MFTGSVIWRGVVYTILMMFGKLVCSLWLVRFSVAPYIPERLKLRKLRLPSMPHFWGTSSEKISNAGRKTDQNRKSSHADTPQSRLAAEQQIFEAQSDETIHQQQHGPPSAQDADGDADSTPAAVRQHTSPDPKNPISLYPASIIGSAMVARGEIGFLISSVAQSKGIFASDAGASDEIFLVVTWAIMLCTIIGPLGVGLLVRRVRKLQNTGETHAVEGKRDVLGVWGVE